MYLELSVAGHLTIFLTRTRGPFWSIRPARILIFAYRILNPVTGEPFSAAPTAFLDGECATS